jgi:HEAT repeat protein
MSFRLPAINQFSFWLGFILATLLWWVVSLIRPALKQMAENARAKRVAKKEKAKSVSAIEERYRQTVLQYAQGMHLAAPLFALDEIIQPPRLLAPPPRVEPGMPIRNEDIVEATVPYLPAWPELAAIYKAPTLTIPEALSGDSDIVLIGQTGMGKTVALACVASRVARRDPEPGLPQDTLPFLIHVADLDLPVNKDNPLNSLIDLIAERAPVLDLPRIPEFVRKAFSDGRALLLLDGTDELTPDALKNAVEFIKLIKRTYPKTRVIATASTEYLDGLVTLNFIPFAIAAWPEIQRAEFLQKWADHWTKFVSVEAWAQSKVEQVDPLLLNGWLAADNAHLTPLELTLKTWGAYAGDTRGPRPMDALETHLRRMTPANVPTQALEILAAQINLAGEPVFDPRKAREWVKSFEPAEQPILPPEIKDESPTQGKGKKPKQEKIQTPSLGLIASLVNSGLLSQHRNNRMRFSHPIFGGFLAGKGLGNHKPDALLEQPPWIGKYLAMQYLAANGDASQLAERLIADQDRPLSRNLLAAARWLRDAPRQAPWRGQVMAKLAELFQHEGQPLGLRGQAAAAFILQGNDPSIAMLFRQMLDGHAAELLQLAALGSGALKDAKAVDLLARLVGNPSTNVRRAACLALAAIGTEASIDALAEVLLHGDENQRRAAAEALANNSGEGHAMLREGAGLKEDLMVRRAAAYGLGRIPDLWAGELLTKLQVEDDQWVVRNSANEAIEDRQRPNLHIPQRLPPPTESPWIIAFAGKQGMGVTPDKPPTDLLILAIKSGSPEERIASINYLRILPVEGVFGVLFQAMYSGDPELREAVFQALSEMAARGVHVPDPVQFGVGY